MPLRIEKLLYSLEIFYNSSLIRSYCLIFTLLLFISNCKDKNKDPENMGFFSLGEAKDYLLFKPGTFWVYESTLNKEIDTMILTYCELDTIHLKGEKREYDMEIISFIIESKRDKAIYFTRNLEDDPDVLNFNLVWDFECYRQGGFYEKFYPGFCTAVQFYYPFDKDHGRLSSASAETVFDDRINAMDVRNKTYNDIVRFKVTPDYSFPYPNEIVGDGCIANYYWAKNNGIIKITIQGLDINNNKIYFNWELIESHIIK